MRLVWVLVGAVAGVIIGAIVGFGVALIAMSFSPARTDGTYGLREVLVCLPVGVILGLLAGIGWGLKTSLALP